MLADAPATKPTPFGFEAAFWTAPTPDQDRLRFDMNAPGIKAAEQFARQLMATKDATLLQTFCALWQLARYTGSFRFYKVPLIQLMAMARLKSGPTIFTLQEQQQFSAGLHALETLTIVLRIQAERINKKGKTCPVLLVERGVPLFRLTSEYTLKEAYRDLPKRALKQAYFDQSVISRFSGELLPDYNQAFSGGSPIDYAALLRLDVNQHPQAMVVGFALQTRFHQQADKSQPLLLERSYLLDLCSNPPTDQPESTVGTNQLPDVMINLKQTGLIAGYENRTDGDEQNVLIYPALKARRLLMG